MKKNKKVLKGTSVIKKPNITLSRSSLLTVYKLFIRPHLDYGDIIYDTTNKNGLSEKM